MENFVNINYELIFYYTKSKLEAENARTFMGYLWWIIDPLMGVLVYYILFKLLLNRGGPDYIQFLFLGLITWKWFDNSVKNSANSIHGSIQLVRKIPIHKSIMPLVEVLYNSWKFFIIFLVVLIGYSFIGYPPKIYLISLPAVLLSQIILIIGISFFLASIVPFIPDLSFLIGYSMRLIFYPSGILFDLAKIPEKYQIYIKWNFIAGLIQSYRNIIMYEKWPVWFALAGCTISGIIFGTIGLYLINKYNRVYPKMS